MTECGLARLVDELRLDFLPSERHSSSKGKVIRWSVMLSGSSGLDDGCRTGKNALAYPLVAVKGVWC